MSNRTIRDQNQSKKRARKSVAKKKPNAKIMVRNVAFQASQREVRELFASFGQLKSVRLPRKMDGSHRGFGFVEFMSKSEAKSAKEALSDAHLYGRHLVIEYADEDADGAAASVEKLIEKAAKHSAKRRRVAENGETAPSELNDDEEMMRDALYN